MNTIPFSLELYQTGHYNVQTIRGDVIVDFRTNNDAPFVCTGRIKGSTYTWRADGAFLDEPTTMNSIVLTLKPEYAIVESVPAPKDVNGYGYFISVATQEEWDAVLAHFTALKYITPSSNTFSSFGAESALWPAEATHVEFCSVSWFAKRGQLAVPFQYFAAIHGLVAKKVRATEQLTLTRGYNASIDFGKEVVTVGCQHISFSKVSELHALITKPE